MAETIKIEIPIEVQDNTDPALSDITERLKGMERAAKNAAKAMRQLSRGMTGAGQGTGRRRSRPTERPESNRPSDPGGGRPTEQPESDRPSDPGGSRPTDQPESNRPSERRGTGLWKTILEAKDMATPTISKVTSKLKSFEKKAWKTTFKVASAPIRKVAGAVTSPLMAAGASLSAGAMVGSSVKTFAGFESTMSQVKAVSGATEAQFEKLTAKAKEMGATTKFTAQEAGEAFNYMAMAGWKPNQMLSGISGIMNLAAASGEDLGTTSDIVTDALTAFGMKASEAGHFSDVLAQASSNANTDVSTMGESFKYVAPVAGALGYKVEDTSLALGLMANASIKGSMAGTSLKTSLANMAHPTKAMAAAMDKYGISLTDSEGGMKSLTGVMENLRSSLGGLSETEQTAAASTIFGKEAMAGMLAIVNASADDWDKLSEAVNHADGASQRMADTMLDNLSGKFTLFQSALDGVKISLGERVSPYLVTALDWITAKMPDVESALMRGMDTVDGFVDGAKDKISGFTSTSEWENADIFGKMHMAWDSLIGDPLADWWSGIESSIKGKAAQIGETIGEGLSGGLLSLLGFDVGEGVNEGVSIGASFAKGFSKGFESLPVLGAAFGAIGGQFLNAGRLLTGDGDASSWASAAAIMRTGIPLLRGAGKAVSGMKKAFGTTTVTGEDGGTMVVPGIGRKILGSAAQGTGLLGLGADTAIKLGAGNLAGGASLSAGAMSAIGLGSIAGGVVGGLGLVSAGINGVKAFRAEDPEEAEAHRDAAFLEGGGALTGAAMGAAIGSVVPGLGTAAGALIGLGIGGLGGMIGGHHVNKNYEEKKAAEETMAEKGKYALEGARFETESLGEAFKDASVSADEFGMMMQEAVSQKVQDGFGNIKLSAQEIQDAASQIMFPDGLDKKLNRFSDAAEQAGASLASVGSDVSSLEKWNWRASLGKQFSEEDKQSYISSIDALTADAMQYLEDKHYEAKMALDLLVEPGMRKDMKSGMDSTYTEIEDRMRSYSDEAERVAGIALEDGVISPDAKVKFMMDGVEMEMSESEALATLQNGITEQVDRMAEAESEAGFQAIKARYSGSDLSYDSYSQLMSGLSSKAEGYIDTAEDAYRKGLANLTMQYGDDTGNPQYIAQKEALDSGFNTKKAEAGAAVEAFGLDTLANTFGTELDGILPQIKGSTAEKVGHALHDAWADGVDTNDWGLGDGLASAVDYLGLDKMSATTQAAVASMMGDISRSLPEEYKALFSDPEIGKAAEEAYQTAMESAQADADKKKLAKSAIEDASKTDAETGSSSSIEDDTGSETTAKAAEEAVDSLSGAIENIDMEKNGASLTDSMQGLFAASMENVDLGDAATAFTDSFGEAMSGIDFSKGGEGAGDGLMEGIQTTLMSSMENIDLSDVAMSLNSKLGEAMSDIDMSEGGDGAGSGLMEGIQATMTASMENVDLSEAAASLNGKLGEAMSSLEMDETGGGLQEGIAASITSSLEGIDLSGVAEGISVSLNEALSGAEGMDFSGFGESLSASLSASVSGMDYSGVTSAVGSGISSAIEVSMGTIQGAISNLYSQVGAAINSAFAAGFQTTTTVTITVNYQLANPTATISFSGGGTGTATVSASIASNAEGSIVNGRILSWVGEDGPEAIIPLGAKRRQRGLELWQEAGRRLGVYEYAEGGIVGGGGTLGGSLWSSVFDGPSSGDGGAPAVFATGIPMGIGGVPAGDGSSSPEINISLSPTFEITSSDSTEVVQEIRAQLSEMAGELAVLIAEGMQESFENMPTV